MKAIILAAGIGKRLKPLTDELPKCLIQILGESLIERYLRTLEAVGIKEAVIVVGHLKEKIKNHLAQTPRRIAVRYIDNADYAKGSVKSLWCARDELNGDVLIMDADVFFPIEFLKNLAFSKKRNAFLLDEKYDDSGEEMKLGAKKGRVYAISRKLSGEYDTVGEGIGFLKLSKEACPTLKTKLDEFIRAGKENCEYEDAINELLSKLEVGFVRTNGLPWTEIDFEGDIEKAEKLDLEARAHLSFNRRLSGWLTKYLARTSITPNQVTLASLIFGLISSAFYYLGGYWNCLLGALIFQVSYTLDNCDGEIARLKNMKSEFGRRFDLTSDVIVYIALISGITSGAYKSSPVHSYALGYLGIAALFGILTSFFLVLYLEKRNLGPATQDASKYYSVKKRSNKGTFEKFINALGGGDFSIMLLAFSLLGNMKWFLIASALGSNIFWISLTLINAFPKIQYEKS